VLAFSSSGVVIIMSTVLVSERVASIISNIKIKISKENRQIYELEWDAFLNTYINTFSNLEGQLINQNSEVIAHQVYLGKDKSELFRIRFISDEINDKIAKAISGKSRDDFLLQCKFESGFYDIVFEIMNYDEKVFEQEYRFELNENEVHTLRANVDLILSGATTGFKLLPNVKLLNER
jgi:hypothetical protein